MKMYPLETVTRIPKEVPVLCLNKQGGFHKGYRNMLATFNYRGYTFYWNDYAEACLVPGKKRGVTCGQSGLMFLETEATRLEDVRALLRSQLALKWDKYLEAIVPYIPIYSGFKNTDMLWLLL